MVRKVEHQRNRGHTDDRNIDISEQLKVVSERFDFDVIEESFKNIVIVDVEKSWAMYTVLWYATDDR